MSIREIRIGMGRTVQLIDFKDTVKYDVSLTVTQQQFESDMDCVRRAQRATAEVFNDVEAVMLDVAKAAAEEECEANPSFGGVNEMTPLDPQFSATHVRTPPRRRRKKQ